MPGSRSGGFSLIEMLVVLILVGLIGTLLFDTMSGMARVLDRTGDQIGNLDQTVPDRRLFQVPVSGIVPDFYDNPDMFAGDRARLSGLTMTPLHSPAGPVPFTLLTRTEAGTSRLIYEEGGRETVLAAWTGGAGRFRYLDGKGEWREEWTVRDARFPYQVPHAVRFDPPDGAGARTMISTIHAFGVHPFRPRDIRF